MPTTALNPSEQRGRLLAGPFKQRVVAQELKINSLNFYENTEPQGGLSIQSPRGWSPMRLYRSRSPEPVACRELRARVSRTATSSSNLSVVLTDHNIDPIARGFQWLRQLARCYGGLLLRAAAFFHRRLAIALLQIRKDNRQNELLLTVIVE